MQIISHRGYWKKSSERNTPLALARSFHLGFGTETDIRDCDGKLVVSHDAPSASALGAEVLLGICQGIDPLLPLALNIKSDGLQKLLPPLLAEHGIRNAFVFDMSIPDSLGWLKTGLPVFTRQSEYESLPAYYDRAAGVWLDAFTADWWDVGVVEGHLSAGKNVCIVSPELHGRDQHAVWEKLSKSAFVGEPRVMLCTDLPEDALEVIHGKN